MAKRNFSIAEVTGGKCDVVAVRLSEADAVQHAASLTATIGGDFRAIATAILRMANLTREVAA